MCCSLLGIISSSIVYVCSLCRCICVCPCLCICVCVCLILMSVLCASVCCVVVCVVSRSVTMYREHVVVRYMPLPVGLAALSFAFDAQS